jgi:pentatricopeptide repeat protein
MSAQLLSYEYFNSMIKPYISDLSVALVFGAGYYLFKFLKNRNENINTIEKKVQNQIKSSIKSKLDKWEQAKSLQIFNGLIISNNNSNVDAFKILPKMQQNCVTPDIITYNCLLDMSLRLDQEENAVKLFEEICDTFSGIYPDIVTFNIMLKHYVSEIKNFTMQKNISNEEKLEKVFKILAEIKSREILVNEITYNTAMDACVEVGDFEKTWELFNEMKQKNLKPDLYTYATLVKGLKNCGLPDAVEKALQILDYVTSGACAQIKADEVLFNSVIDICIANGKVHTAEKIFDDMKKSSHIKPSIVTYSIMIRGYGIVFNIQKAIELYEEIKQKGMQPNDIIYGCMMNCAVRCSNLPLMLQIFELMKNQGMKPNAIIYTTLIKGYNKMKQYQKAFEIFDQLSNEDKNKTNIVIYNVILDVCVESGNFEKLKEIYNHLKNKALENDVNPQPNLVTYSTVIKGFFKSNNFAEAFNIYEFLKTNKFKIDEVFFSIMIDNLVAACEYAKAEALFKEMQVLNIKRSSVIYSILIKMYAKSAQNSSSSTDMEKAVSLIKKMKEDGVKPSVISYTTLMQMFIKKKAIKQAINIFNEIKKEGLQPDQVCYNFIINGCTFNQNLENAIVFLLESLEKNVKLNDETYKNALEYLLNNKFMKYNDRVKHATNILNALNSKNIKVNYDLYSRLVRLIYKTNEEKNEKKIESEVSKNFKNYTCLYQKKNY